MMGTEWNFAKGPGTGIPCGASHISSAKVCRLDAGERKKIQGELAKKGFSSAAIKRMNDGQLSAANKLDKAPAVKPKTAAAKKTVEPGETAVKKPVEKSGSTATGVGTAHELSMLKELGVKLNSDQQEILDKNLKRSGDKKDVVQKLAKENAKDLRAKLEKEGYSIKEVIWTAQLRGDSLAKAAGIEGLSDKNNQSDILMKITKDGKQETIGVSLKSATSKTTYPRDTPFFNGGLGKESKRFGLEGLDEETNKMAADARKRLGITEKTQSAQKKAITSSPSLKAKADAEGDKVLLYVRDKFIDRMKTMDPDELRGLLSTMTGAPTGAGTQLKTYKLTGYSKGKQSTKIEDAVDGKVPRALRGAEQFTLEPAGVKSIRIIADGVPLMYLRVKYPGGSLSSSIKFSGEAP